MTINWAFLAVGAALLLPPPYISRSASRNLLDPRRNSPGSLAGVFLAWQNWVDLFRALVGTYIVNMAITAGPEAQGAGSSIIAAKGAVLGLAALIQVVRFGRAVYAGVQLLGPIFYLSGATLVLAGGAAGGFAIVVGWLFALAGKSVSFQIPVMLAALMAGVVIFGAELNLILNCGLVLLPLILAFVCRRRLLFIVQRPSFSSP